MKAKGRFEVLMEEMNGKFDVMMEYAREIPGIKVILADHTQRLERIEQRLEVVGVVVKEHSQDIREPKARR